MQTGKVTISIDLELAWGVWDTVSSEDLRLAQTSERPICRALVDLFDRHQIPATWLIVAALLDLDSAKSRPGDISCWYAPDVIDMITSAKSRHEIGSHSGRHIYFDEIVASVAQEDLDFATSVHRTHGLPFRSFVYPRGGVGHLDLVERAGARVVRNHDVGLLRTVRHGGRIVARAMNFADQFFAVPPQPAFAETCGSLIDLPGSMQVPGRNGLRRFVLPAVTRRKLAFGLMRAQSSGGTFHLWFHPSNFYYRCEEQLETFDWFLSRVANAASCGDIELRTMGAYG